MTQRRHNTQLFALPEPPPDHLTVGGREYRLAKVFKHDFFAATALYEADDAPDRLVVKFGRVQNFCGLPGAWLGRALRAREQHFHRRADGIDGIQRWVVQLSDTAYALAYIEGRTLDTFESPPQPGEFFDALRAMLDALHARQAAYGDLNKRSNILVTPEGRPGLIDFQISVVHDPHAHRLWRWLSRRWVAYLQRMDLYHLYKHKRRMAREHLRPEEEALSRRRGRIIWLHRRLVTPIRRLRRAFLTRRHRAGKLVSPSAHLEDHHQPEKATWRES